MESAEGILLFTKRDNATAWLQYQANRFFDKDYATDRLRIWDVAGLNPDLLSQVNSCKLPEELASTSFAKTIDAVGTPAILKSGICRAEYDMGPSLKNFVEFVLPKQHDPLQMSTRNRKLTQLIAIAEDGKLPPNFNRLDWIGTPFGRMSYPDNHDNRTGDELKQIAATLLNKIYPDTRVAQNGFTFKTQQEKCNNVDSLRKTGTADTGYTRRAVPSLPQGRVKRTPSL